MSLNNGEVSFALKYEIFNDDNDHCTSILKIFSKLTVQSTNNINIK